MWDVLYVAGSIGFFVLMLAYVRGCTRLGGETGDTESLP